MSDHAEDELLLHTDTGDLLMTRENATLYTFVGRWATRNHVFIVTEETETHSMGVHIWAHSKTFEPLVSFIAEWDYPMRLNALRVDPSDEQAFQNSLDQLTGIAESDYLPDDWE